MTSLTPLPAVASAPIPKNVTETLELLDAHHRAFFDALPFATKTGHTTPSDTKSWSQMLVSILTGLSGRARKKGSDLDDGSDVKAANTWSAIDTPRFNGCIPAGRLSKTSKKPGDITALDDTPFIFFVLWDAKRPGEHMRCRVWVVRPSVDPVFRKMCAGWYDGVASGHIISTNFQLHPPRNLDTNIIRNTCGNLTYPLLFSAEHDGTRYDMTSYDPTVLTSGLCVPI
jgi:hypothetical protein